MLEMSPEMQAKMAKDELIALRGEVEWLRHVVAQLVHASDKRSAQLEDAKVLVQAQIAETKAPDIMTATPRTAMEAARARFAKLVNMI